MAADEIKVGDVVQLKSGGPKMTVSQVARTAKFAGDTSGPMSAWCDWFVADRAPWKKEKGTFPLTSLNKVD